MPEFPPQALDDLKVVELPCFDPMPFFAASMAAKVMADLGAEVIKVEPPKQGAPDRRWGPYRGQKRDPETNGLHLYLNTNKLGVTLDLGNARGRELLHELLATSDILFNPNAPALSERLGIDWRTLVARFPNLVVVSTTFFGAESQYRNFRGGDLAATQMGVVGFGTPMQQVVDPPNQPPLRLGGRQADYVTGYTAAGAALCAVFARKRNSRAGLHVDVSQWLSVAQMCRPEISIYTHEAEGAPYRQRLIMRRKSNIQYIFPCKDGWVSCGLASNRHWNAMKHMMGDPEWAESEMFSSFEGRLQNADALEAVLIEWFSTRTRKHLFDIAQAGHVPSFPVNSPAEVAHNEQYAARRYFVDCEHPVAGKVRMPGAPFIMSRTPWRIRSAAPRLGEHNLKILGERLGLSHGEIEAMATKAASLIADASHPREAHANLQQPSTRESPPPHGHRPFQGIRIADFGWIYALPYGTAWLGALGADVIKIESSVRPDLVRFLSGTDGKSGVNRSGIFNGINFSKRSLALNLSHPHAREVALRLVSKSDIATENFTSATMKKLGLAYEDLRRVKPDLVMLSATSLGQTGPLASAVGWGPTNQAFAGTSHLTGYPNGFPSAGGGTWPDFAVGIATLFAMLAALHYRDRTGEGQHIDVSMCEVVTSMLPEAMLEYFMNGRELGPIGNRDPEMAPHGVFPTAGDDLWITIAIVTDAEFGALCEAIGVPALATDPRYVTTAKRLQNVESLDHEIAARTRNFERDELVTMLRARNLCTAPVYSTPDLMRDPAFIDSGMLVRLRHKECGERAIPGLPVRFSAFEPNYSPAPLAGEHTIEILSGLLGYSAKEIERLHADKVII
jgi:crotonobetainyl-CoA:carnitine CoA-transferase CaiB-like acyl-CoA transferase